MRAPLPTNKMTCPQSLSPKFTNLWAKYPTRYTIARKYETFASLLLVHTEKKGDTLPLKSANLGLKDWGLELTVAVRPVSIEHGYLSEGRTLLSL
jgi:hypothetical protein